MTLIPFDEQYAAEALPDLMAMFGEEVIVRPANDPPYTVTGMVDRDAAQAMPGVQGVSTRSLLVELFNDERLGIASEQLDVNTWKLDVPLVKGGCPQTCTIKQKIRDDGGSILLLVN